MGAADAERIEVDRKPKKKSIDITVDSGAGASCWTQGLLKKVPMQSRAKGVRFRAANGAELQYLGTKNIKFKVGGEDRVCDMKFHVTDTTKPLGGARGRFRQVVHRERRDWQEGHVEGARRNICLRR